MNETNNANKIARNTKQIRLDNHLTQLEMTTRLGYAERTIRRLETNGTYNLSVINLISTVFNVSAQSILFN